MERDEDLTHQLVNVCFDRLEDSVRCFGGSVCEKRGDALLARFEQPSDGLGASLMYQHDAEAQLSRLDGEIRPELRIGINLGEVIADRGTIWGPGVNLTQRVEQLSEPGGVCVSATVYEAVSKSLPIDYVDLGVRQVKESDVHAYSAFLRKGKAIAPSDRSKSSVREPSARPEKSSIAVLPFQSLSGDEEIRFMGAGLTDDLTILLARVPGFFVVSRDSAEAYDARQGDMAQAASSLGVRYLVTGRIRGAGDHFRVTTELVDADSGETLWRQNFDERTGEDILNLQSDIAREITKCIEPELARAEFSRVQRQPHAHVGAWDLYHQARGLMIIKGIGAENIRKAIEFLRRAIELNPEFALAHAYLTLMYAFSNVLNVDVGEGDLPVKAMESLNRALELDRRDATVLGFTGCALCDLHHHQRGVDLLEQAVQIDPSNALAQAALGAGLVSSGAEEKGIEYLRNGIRLSPLDERAAFWSTLLARALLRIGRVDEAAAEAKRACQNSDTVAAARVVFAVIELERGNLRSATEAFEEAKRIDSSIEEHTMRPLIGKRGIQSLRQAGLLA
jgi:TolB-like protein/Tfp pilus assembly protein PilF